MKQIYLILASMVWAMLASCNHRVKEENSGRMVKIDTVFTADRQNSLQLPGKVKAAQDVSLAFRVSGTIQKVYVDDGAPVRKGQLLAELDPADYRVQLEATEAEYRQVKAEAERVMAFIRKTGLPPTPTTRQCMD